MDGRASLEISNKKIMAGHIRFMKKDVEFRESQDRRVNHNILEQVLTKVKQVQAQVTQLDGELDKTQSLHSVLERKFGQNLHQSDWYKEQNEGECGSVCREREVNEWMRR